MHHVSVIGGSGLLVAVSRRSYALIFKLCQHKSTECTYILYVHLKLISLMKRYVSFIVLHEFYNSLLFNFICLQVSHGKMVTQKMVDMLPSSTMPRPILRSFGAERNVTDQAGSTL